MKPFLYRYIALNGIVCKLKQCNVNMLNFGITYSHFLVRSNAENKNSFWLYAFEIFQEFRNINSMYMFNLALWICVRDVCCTFVVLWKWTIEYPCVRKLNQHFYYQHTRINGFLSISFEQRKVRVMMHRTFAELFLLRWTLFATYLII